MQTVSREWQRTWSRLLSLHSGQAAGLALAVGTVAVMSRLLGPAEYGRFALVMTAAQYAMIVSVSWTSAALIRFGREAYVRAGVIGDVFWTRLAVTAPAVGIAIGIMYTFRTPIARVLPMGQTPLALIVVAVIALMAADQVDGTLQSTDRWAVFAWLPAIEKVTMIALIVAAAASRRLSGTVAVLAVIVSQLIRSGIGLWTARRSLTTCGTALNRGVGRAILRYAWPQIFTFTIGYASTVVEPFLIRRYASLAAVGIYQVAFQLSAAGALLLSPMSSLLFPALTSLRLGNRHDVLITVVDRLVPQVVLVLNVMLAIGMIAAASLFEPIFGAPYADGTRPLLILLAAASFQTITMLYSPLLAAYDLTKHSAVLNTVGGVVMHLLPELLLISWWGMTGAATSWLIWYAFSASFCVVVAVMRIGVRRFSILLYPVIPVATLAVLLTIDHMLPRIVAVSAIFGVAITVVRRVHVFRTGDVDLLQAVGVPQPVCRLAMKAYAAL